MLNSIIYNSIRMTGNSHRHFGYRINGLPTIGHIKDYRSKVVVGVVEMLSNQFHIGGTCKSSYSGITTTESKVTLRIKRITDGDFIANHTMFSTIIYYRVDMTVNSHRHFRNWSYRLVSISHHKSHLREVIVGIGKLFNSQTHVGGTRIGSGYYSCTTETEVISRIKRIANADNVITAHLVRLSIVFYCTVMTTNHHSHFIKCVNLLPTIRHVKDNRSKVVVSIFKLFSGQPHIGGA